MDPHPHWSLNRHGVPNDELPGTAEGVVNHVIGNWTRVGWVLASILGLAAAACIRSPAPTPTPPATAAPTATRTPTAEPLALADDLRDRLFRAPVEESGAPCGRVDSLDYPVGPPDGDGFGARWVFGRHSGRYRSIHAGEDWRLGSRGTSLGQPVYSVGHGAVTYAQPYGWGTDQGVVIVRHMFPDDSTVLSFYGHLDPPSVVLSAGDCVQRGQEVGAIGKPRSSPHLHFEIRDHMPTEPGPGYWAVDPRLAGWHAPSDYIENYRVAAAPGVRWTKAYTSTDSTAIGVLADGTVAALFAPWLVGLDAGDGAELWRVAVPARVSPAVLDESGTAIYLPVRGPAVHGVIPAMAETEPAVHSWTHALADSGRVMLIPLPGGGVGAHAGGALTALSPAGVELWSLEGVPAPVDWARVGDEVLFTTPAENAALGILDRQGQLRWGAPVSGRLAVSGAKVYAYDGTGVYRLSADFRTAIRVVLLDRGVVTDGHIAALPGGGVAVTHRGRHDIRLLAVAPGGQGSSGGSPAALDGRDGSSGGSPEPLDGGPGPADTLLWDRSLASLTDGPAFPFVVADALHLLTKEGDVLWVDRQTGVAQRVFRGPVVPSPAATVWALPTGGTGVVFDPGRGQAVALDSWAVAQGGP